MKNSNLQQWSRTIRIISLCFVSLLVVLFMFSCGNGSGTPSATDGTVQGTVFDDDSLQGLKGVAVSIGTLSTKTDSEGKYLISGVPAGSQTISVSRYDYDAENQTVQVTAGVNNTVDISMFSNLDEWLETGTTYKWQVEVVQEDGTVISGPVWSFSTDDQKKLSPVVISKSVTGDSVRTIAKTFLKNMQNDDRTIVSVDPVKNKAGVTIAYLINLDPAGYIIIPASLSEVLPPILSYSFDESLSLQDRKSHIFIDMVRNDIQMRLNALSKGERLPQDILTKNRTLWNRYLAGESDIINKQRAVYGPLLSIPTWNQSEPFNALCPMDPVTGDRCIVGCVATAYSQIFNYWGQPNTIDFTSDDNYTTHTRGIFIDATTGSFSNLVYLNNNTVKAKVSYASGIIARMNYTSEGSGADTVGFGKTLSERYSYGKTSVAHFDSAEAFSGTAMAEDMKAMPWGRPVALAITKVDAEGNWKGGHAIVCDGYYEALGTFHLNMGWGGSKNGWYSLPSGMPSNYSVVKAYIYNISPTNVKTGKNKTARAASPENPYPTDGERSITTDQTLDWDECDDAKYYNCYVWKASEQKPATPTYNKLRDAVAYPELLPH